MLARIVLTLSLLLTAPGCELFAQPDKAAVAAVDELREAAVALSILDNLTNGYVTGASNELTPDQLLKAATGVVNLEAARTSLVLSREALKHGDLLEAAVEADRALTSLEAVAKWLSAEGVDTSAADLALKRARQLLKAVS